MLDFLPPFIKGPVAFCLFGLNTLFWCLLLYPIVVLKILIPMPGFRRWTTRIMIAIAEIWITCNSLSLALLHRFEFEIQGLEGLRRKGSYLVISNHQSWVDITILQHVFNRRIPFLRFFLKQQLLYVPLLGGAWWALDFPFMKRYTPEYLAKHPERRGHDLETTRQACAKFIGSPISVLNFLEGTRFTPEKHAKQNSPYRHLLKPKIGGIAFVIEAMGRQFDAVVDVTLFYPEGAVSLWQFMQGRLHKVVVRIRRLEIPPALLQNKPGLYLESDEYREAMRQWITTIWRQKDGLLSALHSG